MWASEFSRAEAKFRTSKFPSSNRTYVLMGKVFSRTPNLNCCSPWKFWCRTWVCQRREINMQWGPIDSAPGEEQSACFNLQLFQLQAQTHSVTFYFWSQCLLRKWVWLYNSISVLVLDTSPTQWSFYPSVCSPQIILSDYGTDLHSNFSITYCSGIGKLSGYQTVHLQSQVKIIKYLPTLEVGEGGG